MAGISKLIHAPLLLALSLAACQDLRSLGQGTGPGRDTGTSGFPDSAPGLQDIRPNPLVDGRPNPLLDRRPVVGLAQDAAGNPLKAATVRAFPVGAAVPGSEAMLVSNGPTFFRVQDAGSTLVATADDAGRFGLEMPPGRYNLEIVSSDGRLKAWKPGVELASTPGASASVGALVARPPGILEGTLTAADPAFTNFLGAEIFLPGSRYLFKMASGSNTFRLEGLPEGEYDLVGWKGNPRSEAHARVTIRSGETTRLDRLVLEPVRPIISQVLTEDGEITDSAAPGAVLEIHGSRFGVSTGDETRIRMGELVLPADVLGRTDALLRFRVPLLARDGAIEVSAAGYVASTPGFRIIRQLAWTTSRLDLFPGQATPDVMPVLRVLDAAGQPVVADVNRGLLPPYVRFWLDDPRTGTFQARDFPVLPPGDHVLHVRAGSLPDVPVPLHVHAPELLPEARLAPDDPGDPAEHHLYTVTKGRVASSFVWIPVFRAYQLIEPANCGPGYRNRPVGAWVADRPPTGIPDEDWASETFGGFYVARVEASRADAVPGDPDTGAGATAGSSGTLKAVPYAVPWTDISRDEARAACLAYDEHADLMSDDAWTALAVWSMIRGVTLHGNTDRGRDASDPVITFVPDATVTGRALTGSGRSPGWPSTVNLTSHTGAPAGVLDLDGNVFEWTGPLGAAASTGQYLLGGVATDVSIPDAGHVVGLSTEPVLRRYGVPARTGAASAAFGGDYFFPNYYNNVSTAALRGGHWADGTKAGIWSLFLHNAQANRSPLVGFRPMLRY
ncbi:MAG: carboxypeptidase-like regulatory domain-containing protein [bacterium]|nr:carboxypeptidase-like regulatory domain-containing protein [bacterium]